MSEPEYVEFEITGTTKPPGYDSRPSVFEIDAGPEVGSMSIIYTDPVTFKVDGEPATRDQANAWLIRWKEAINEERRRQRREQTQQAPPADQA